MLSDRAFTFLVHIPWGKTLSLVTKLRSSVKVNVKYQGHSFQTKWLLRPHVCFTSTSFYKELYSKVKILFCYYNRVLYNTVTDKKKSRTFPNRKHYQTLFGIFLWYIQSWNLTALTKKGFEIWRGGGGGGGGGKEHFHLFTLYFIASWRRSHYLNDSQFWGLQIRCFQFGQVIFLKLCKEIIGCHLIQNLLWL